MKTEEEKRWEMMQRVLLAESRGEAPVRVSSQKTLFGIKSHVETVIERTAAEEDERALEKLRQSKAGYPDAQDVGATE
ncbi:MAG: hypothetical protein LUD25_00340 [Coriobacteriaceae bacterium]|nr:hypothetical protein [Coriobacteriaceae bacterium]